MGSVVIPLPPGYAVGDRIKTNAAYALVNARCKGPRYGVIINGSRSADGPVKIMLENHKHAHAMTLNLFEVVAKGS